MSDPRSDQGLQPVHLHGFPDQGRHDLREPQIGFAEGRRAAPARKVHHADDVLSDDDRHADETAALVIALPGQRGEVGRPDVLDQQRRAPFEHPARDGLPASRSLVPRGGGKLLGGTPELQPGRVPIALRQQHDGTRGRIGHRSGEADQLLEVGAEILPLAHEDCQVVQPAERALAQSLFLPRWRGAPMLAGHDARFEITAARIPAPERGCGTTPAGSPCRARSSARSPG